MFHLADVLAQERASLAAPEGGWTAASADRHLRGRKTAVLPENAPDLHLSLGDAERDPVTHALDDVEAAWGPAGVEAAVTCIDAPVVATASELEADGQRQFNLITVLKPAAGPHVLVAGLFATAFIRKRGKPVVVRACEILVVRADIAPQVGALLERAYEHTEQPERAIKARGRERAPRLGWYGVPPHTDGLPDAFDSRLAAVAAVQGYERFVPSNPHNDARLAVRQIIDAGPEVVAIWSEGAPPGGATELATKFDGPVLSLSADDPMVALDRLRAQLEDHPVGELVVQPGPGSVAEALGQAKEEAEHLIYLHSADRSAKRSPFTKPSDVLKALQALDRIAGKYARGDIDAGGFEAAFGAENQLYSANISETARNGFRGDYTIEYEGQTVLMGPHLRLGSSWSEFHCARIYWHRDQDNRKFVVGHVGKHLRGAGDA